MILWLTYSPSDNAIQCNFLLSSLFSSTTWRIVSSLYDRPSLCSAWSTGFTHFGENKISLIFDQKRFTFHFHEKNGCNWHCKLLTFLHSFLVTMKSLRFSLKKSSPKYRDVLCVVIRSLILITSIFAKRWDSLAFSKIMVKKVAKIG